MKRHTFILHVASAVVASTLIVHEARPQESGCRNGAEAAAHAYLRHNFLFSLYLGDLETYVTQNAAQFRRGSDAIRCLSELSQAYAQVSFSLYDPQEQRRRDEINAELGTMGIPQAPQESTASADAFHASLRLARLARTLPAAANGDFTPLRTPTTELEQLEATAEQMLQLFLGDPSVRAVFAEMQPLIQELMNIEYQTVLAHAAALAGPSQGAAAAPALDCDPAVAECGIATAILALAREDVATAREAFLRIRNAAPSNGQLALTEGLIWYKAGHLADAEQATRRALAIDPESYSAHDNLAFILFDLNRVSEALTHWESALEIEDEPDAMAGKAIALRVLGRQAEALELYELAVLANGDYLDCEVLQEKYSWSTTACAAAAPIIWQVQ